MSSHQSTQDEISRVLSSMSMVRGFPLTGSEDKTTGTSTGTTRDVMINNRSLRKIDRIVSLKEIHDNTSPLLSPYTNKFQRS